MKGIRPVEARIYPPRWRRTEWTISVRLYDYDRHENSWTAFWGKDANEVIQQFQNGMAVYEKGK